MATTRSPRQGSLQFWPRVRAKRSYARVRNAPAVKDCKMLGFSGYKVGMSHMMVVDNYKNSSTKGEEICVPITIVECPPIKIASVRFYKKGPTLRLVKEIRAKLDKEAERKIIGSKKETDPAKELEAIDAKDFTEVRIMVYTQPKFTGIKKKPEMFELRMGGSVEEKLAYAKQNIGKDIRISDVYKEGDQVDVHAITKGKGFQGAVRKFGISLRQKKSEKSTRNPGSLGPWCAQAHIMWRVAHSGKMGFHQRTEYNKRIAKISADATEVSQEGGITHYGTVKNDYVLLEGSVPGPKKRLIIFTPSIRPTPKKTKEVPNIVYISKSSKQGR